MSLTEGSDHTSFSHEERADGHYYRWPADDTDAEFVGPFPDRAAVEAAALATIEKFITDAVKAAFDFT